MRWLLLALLSVCSGPPIGGQEEGYRLARDRVVIDRPEHWRGWEGAVGGHLIGADGRVEPRFARRQINAVLNAGQFETVVAGGDTLRGGVREAGSNWAAAHRVMDGDPTTYWEPAPGDSLQNWFVEIDLGRAVIAQTIVVRFVGEGAGDPFLKFRVVLSDGSQTSIGDQEPQPRFFRGGQATRPNKSQRQFTFAVQPQRPVPPGVEGEVVQLVRFEALDSDGPRAAPVDSAAYFDLPLADRGAVDYFRQTVAGRPIPVDLETYQALPALEKAPVRYYRHERPRLAEIEIHTPGDNIISLTQRILNRESDLFANPVLALSTDGIFTSRYPLRVYDPLRHRNQLEIDLGAKYWLERIRLLTPQEPLTAYQVRLSDGTLDPSGTRLWNVLDERLNKESFLQLEEVFPLQEVRFVELRRLQLVGAREETGSLGEIQAYGEGYVSEVVLTSPMIRLQGSRMFTAVEWDGEAPVDTRLEIRTRSGDDLLRLTQYFDRFGRQISQDQWESIAQRNRGDVLVEELPGPNWSNWSELYDRSGTPFKSPSPRRFALAQVRLLTRNPLRTASIRRLQLGLEPPLVEQVFAEIWPTAGVVPGVEAQFTLYMRPRFGPGDAGFDRLRLRSSSSAPIGLQRLQRGSAGALRLGAGRDLWPGEAELSALEDGGIELAFPRPITGGTEIYAATFATQVFLIGTTFSAELTRATRPGVVQVASAGEAAELVESQSLVVVADLQGASLLHGVEVVPPVFTPNGDGVNDVAQIQFSIFRLKGARRLNVEIRDLQGRPVRDLSIVRTHPSGLHRVAWDGRDQRGGLVAPGMYLARVSFSPDFADSQVDGTQALRLVRLVY
ncbi:MAG: hypothetical protein GKR89_11095 [Candidatus Latescibacteria bacterium]|nr:hypothetical protein [Candidatus Latescibacterota bacterium]